MAPRYLLDTDTCIYIRRNRPPAALARLQKTKVGDAAISVITYGELVYGAEKSVEPKRAAAGLSRLVALLPVLALPENAADAYGAIRARLAAKGQLIGPNDLWIAAHALASKLILVTNNTREFKRIPDLKIENWVE